MRTGYRLARAISTHCRAGMAATHTLCWRRLAPAATLSLATTLTNGQCFAWRQVVLDTGAVAWASVFCGRLVLLREPTSAAPMAIVSPTKPAGKRKRAPAVEEPPVVLPAVAAPAAVAVEAAGSQHGYVEWTAVPPSGATVLLRAATQPHSMPPPPYHHSPLQKARRVRWP
jgi:hypothetical protein